MAINNNNSNNNNNDNNNNNNNNNNSNNNVIIIKMIITAKMESGCSLKKNKSSYIYCPHHFISLFNMFKG